MLEINLDITIIIFVFIWIVCTISYNSTQLHFEHVEKKQTNFNVAVEARKRYESLTEKDNKITGTF